MLVDDFPQSVVDFAIYNSPSPFIDSSKTFTFYRLIYDSLLTLID